MSDFIATASNLATSFSLLLALIAYMENNKSERLKTMQSMFSDYLKMSLDLSRNYKPDDAEESDIRNYYPKGVYEDFISFKLYTLEEMFIWIQKESFLVKFTPWANKAYIDNWRATISTHVSDDYEDIEKNISKYRGCYNEKFIQSITKDIELHKSKLSPPKNEDKND